MLCSYAKQTRHLRILKNWILWYNSYSQPTLAWHIDLELNLQPACIIVFFRLICVCFFALSVVLQTPVPTRQGRESTSFVRDACTTQWFPRFFVGLTWGFILALAKKLSYLCLSLKKYVDHLHVYTSAFVLNSLALLQLNSFSAALREPTRVRKFIGEMESQACRAENIDRKSVV